jgi:hypothetical protein
MITSKMKPEPIDEKQKRIIDLTLGRVTPSNDEERELLDQIEKAKSEGRIIDLPFE